MSLEAAVGQMYMWYFFTVSAGVQPSVAIYIKNDMWGNTSVPGISENIQGGFFYIIPLTSLTHGELSPPPHPPPRWSLLPWR